MERGFRPSALRYLFLGVHYRKQLKFSWTAMAQAEEALQAADRFSRAVSTLPAGSPPAGRARLEEARAAFRRAHRARRQHAPRRLASIFELVRALNSAIDSGELAAPDAEAVRQTFDRFDRVLGVLVATAGRGCAAAGSGRGDRAADRRPARGAAAREISPKPTGFEGSRRARDRPRGSAVSTERRWKPTEYERPRASRTST